MRPAERAGSDADGVARAVEAIEGTWFICIVVLISGFVWIIVALAAGWGLVVWAMGEAVWAILLFLAVRSLQSLGCSDAAARVDLR